MQANIMYTIKYSFKTLSRKFFVIPRPHIPVVYHVTFPVYHPTLHFVGLISKLQA